MNVIDLILKSPEMFIGHAWDTEGLHLLIFEIIELAVQPVNECSILTIALEQNGALSIKDDGRGLPIEPISIDKSVERPILEHIMTWFLKTNPNQDYYRHFGFLDHLGGVLNAVSISLRIETVNNGLMYTLHCSQGNIVEPLKKVGMSRSKGTKLTFLPDPLVFGNLTFQDDKIIEKLSELSIKYPNILFRFVDERVGRIEEFLN